MLIPKPPLFVIDGFDLVVLHTMRDLIVWLEPPDIADINCLICDCQGRRLYFDTIVPEGFTGGPAYVFLKEVDDELLLATRLSTAIRDYLKMQKIDEQDQREITLDQLVQRFVLAQRE